MDQSGLRNFAFAPESASVEVLSAIRKQVKIPRLIEAVRVVLKTRMTVCCFIVIGFPEETRATLRETLAFVRRLAFLGVHDLTVSMFTPYPGSDYFKELRSAGMISEGLDEMEKVIDFFSSDGRSYSREVGSRSLFRWMMWIYLNFYILSFLRRPLRVLKYFALFLSNGVETTRYVRLFAEVFLRRKKWKRSMQSSAA